MPKKPSVADFLAAPYRPISTCVTCQHSQRKAIEEDCNEFTAARKSGKTTMPWSYFVKYHIRPVHGYAHHPRTLKHHMEECLGRETS